MPDELKPCLCGSRVEMRGYRKDGLEIVCSCGVKFQQRVLVNTLGWLREKMTVAWNTRPLESRLERERDALRAEVERLTAEVEILSAIDDLFMGKIVPVDDEWLHQQRYRLKQLRAQNAKGGA